MRPTLLYSIIQSLVAFPLTPKYMTLNDLEILNGYFSLNFFHYYEPRFQQLGYIVYIQLGCTYSRACLHTTSEVMRERTVNCGIFEIRRKTADLS